MSPRLRFSRARWSADPAPLSALLDCWVLVFRLWTANLGALAEDARADSKGLMAALAVVALLMVLVLVLVLLRRAFLFFGVGRPLGRADAFCLYFLFAILDQINS